VWWQGGRDCYESLSKKHEYDPQAHVERNTIIEEATVVVAVVVVVMIRMVKIKCSPCAMA
jgi:hypothetical protein